MPCREIFFILPPEALSVSMPVIEPVVAFGVKLAVIILLTPPPVKLKELGE